MPAGWAAAPEEVKERWPLVLGFRGQGQSARGFHGAGREAGQVAEGLAQRLDSRVIGVPGYGVGCWI